MKILQKTEILIVYTGGGNIAEFANIQIFWRKNSRDIGPQCKGGPISPNVQISPKFFSINFLTNGKFKKKFEKLNAIYLINLT